MSGPRGSSTGLPRPKIGLRSSSGDGECWVSAVAPWGRREQRKGFQRGKATSFTHGDGVRTRKSPLVGSYLASQSVTPSSSPAKPPSGPCPDRQGV